MQVLHQLAQTAVSEQIHVHLWSMHICAHTAVRGLQRSKALAASSLAPANMQIQVCIYDAHANSNACSAMIAPVTSRRA